MQDKRKDNENQLEYHRTRKIPKPACTTGVNLAKEGKKKLKFQLQETEMTEVREDKQKVANENMIFQTMSMTM